MTEIKEIKPKRKKVEYTDGTELTLQQFRKQFTRFWNKRICGESLGFNSMEHFMRRTSSKNLKALMKGKKMEGYMEGVQDKMLTPRQKLAIGTVVTLVMVGLVVFIVLRNQGVLNF